MVPGSQDRRPPSLEDSLVPPEGRTELVPGSQDRRPPSLEDSLVPPEGRTELVPGSQAPLGGGDGCDLVECA